MKELLSVLKNFSETFPNWFIFTYIAFLVVGIITACANRKNFNCIFWLIIVITMPFYGTAVTIICCTFMNVITRDKPKYIFDYGFRKKFLLIPFFTASAGSLVSEYITDFYNETFYEKLNFPLTAESFPILTAFTVLFLMFLVSYYKKRKNFVCLHINKVLPEREVPYEVSKNIYGFKCIEEKKELIPSHHEVKNIAELYYRKKGLESGDFSWEYHASVGKNEFNFNVMTAREFRKYLDVETAENPVKGITKMSVLQWDEKAVAEDNKEVPVKRYVLWHTLPPVAPLMLETITSLMMITVSFTPLGLEIFFGILNSFSKFFS